MFSFHNNISFPSQNNKKKKVMMLFSKQPQMWDTHTIDDLSEDQN